MENDRYNDFSGILTFVSGALIVLALLMSCWPRVESDRMVTRPDGR